MFLEKKILLFWLSLYSVYTWGPLVVIGLCVCIHKSQ